MPSCDDCGTFDYDPFNEGNECPCAAQPHCKSCNAFLTIFEVKHCNGVCSRCETADIINGLAGQDSFESELIRDQLDAGHVAAARYMAGQL